MSSRFGGQADHVISLDKGSGSSPWPWTIGPLDNRTWMESSPADGGGTVSFWAAYKGIGRGHGSWNQPATCVT